MTKHGIDMDEQLRKDRALSSTLKRGAPDPHSHPDPKRPESAPQGEEEPSRPGAAPEDGLEGPVPTSLTGDVAERPNLTHGQQPYGAPGTPGGVPISQEQQAQQAAAAQAANDWAANRTIEAWVRRGGNPSTMFNEAKQLHTMLRKNGVKL